MNIKNSTGAPVVVSGVGSSMKVTYYLVLGYLAVLFMAYCGT